MEALIEYALIGVVALAFLYLMSPTLINFFDEASSAITNSSELSSSEQDLITATLLLTFILFYLFGVWVMYGAVQNRIENM